MLSHRDQSKPTTGNWDFSSNIFRRPRHQSRSNPYHTRCSIFTLRCQDFLPKLKEHLLSRLEVMRHKELPVMAPSWQAVDSQMVFFQNNTMYQHSVMQVNYTTYDVRRAQDTLNPKTDHRDIMILSGTEDGVRNLTTHPYKYARILRIYHVNLVYSEPTVHQYQKCRMEFLWVRYFDVVQNLPVGRGWTTPCLDQLQFRQIDRVDAFGFVDPAQVLRGCHLIPKFCLGKCHGGDETAVLSCAQDVQDWVGYYANR